ncbi:hypothetical protein EYC84_004073 [Monilinia fructicola]|uniref:N-acetyltransferase domain-containing protein n=1 Tax=Monilinia fructicola TaxID=38448 RepID=A0A5M9JZ61_MONFR|nr:hypothetical protein EYC84_004073 [Monilinia fructicola]
MPIQHHPLHPTLTLNSPHPHHQNIILTRPRPSDAAPTIPAFNQPAIYLHLTGPPFPYTQESFDAFFHDVLDRKAKIAAAELWDARAAEEQGGPRSWVEALPFPSIREVAEGICDGFGGGEREGLVRRNGERRTGDPGVEWEVGFWLLPTHHNRGIMPAVLQTLLSDFAIPYMNVHTLIGEYLEYNLASKRVFEKCGFGFEGVVEGVETLAAGKRARAGRVSGAGTGQGEGLGGEGHALAGRGEGRRREFALGESGVSRGGGAWVGSRSAGVNACE